MEKKKSLSKSLPLAVLALTTASSNNAFAKVKPDYKFVGSCVTEVTITPDKFINEKFYGSHATFNLNFFPQGEFSESDDWDGSYVQFAGAYLGKDETIKSATGPLSYSVNSDNSIRIFDYSGTSGTREIGYRETIITGIDPKLKKVPQKGMVQIGDDITPLWQYKHALPYDQSYDEVVRYMLGRSFPVTCTFEK